MAGMKNQIELGLLDTSRNSSLRSVAGFNWLQHLAMVATCDDRADLARSWNHAEAAAKSYVASLQLFAVGDERLWFHLSKDAVLEAMRPYLLPLATPMEELFETAFWKFGAKVEAVVAEVEPSLSRICRTGDISMVSNAYLNAVRRMPPGVGVYHVRDHSGFTEISVHAPSSIRRYLGQLYDPKQSRVLDDVADYYNVLASRHSNGYIHLGEEDLAIAEGALATLAEQSDDLRIASGFTLCGNGPRETSPAPASLSYGS